MLLNKKRKKSILKIYSQELKNESIICNHTNTGKRTKHKNDKFISTKLFKFDSILMKKVVNKEFFYLVKWKGYSTSENTWEPTFNFATSMNEINKFNKKIELEKKLLKKRKEKNTFKNELELKTNHIIELKNKLAIIEKEQILEGLNFNEKITNIYQQNIDLSNIINFEKNKFTNEIELKTSHIIELKSKINSIEIAENLKELNFTEKLNNAYQKNIDFSNIIDLEKNKFINEIDLKSNQIIELNTEINAKKDTNDELTIKLNSKKKKIDECMAKILNLNIINQNNQNYNEFIKECPICFDQQNSKNFPCVIDCGHTMCFNCFRKIRNINKKCPFCGKDFYHHPIKNYALSGIIDKISLNF
jgi:hypothetical protein